MPRGPDFARPQGSASNSHTRRWYAGWALAAVALLATALAIWQFGGSKRLPPEVENGLLLLNLEPNQWIKYHEERPGNWTRQGHAGMALDTKRGSLLIFGSDTHGANWDNTVHEFQILARRWETHQAAAEPRTYRVDAKGIPVAGAGTPVPWAMHTYDAVEYHPKWDALVAMSTTDHTSPPGPMPKIGQQRTWIYDLSSRQWRMFENAGNPSPTFFGGASAYDTRRGVLVGYGGGVWELDATAGAWRKASSESHHGMHHAMAFDSRRGALFVFGDYRPTNIVWSYLPDPLGGQGRWTAHQPKGDACPPYSSVPVAYASASDVFVLVVDEVKPDQAQRTPAGSASTYLYDPAADVYKKLAAAELPAVGMNYMMAWDPRHDAVLLVTGDWHGTVTVWALKPRK